MQRVDAVVVVADLFGKRGVFGLQQLDELLGDSDIERAELRARGGAAGSHTAAADP